MKNKIIAKATELLNEGRITGFLALRDDGNHIAPYMFTDPEELKDLSFGDKNKPGDSRYPLVTQLARIAKARPKDVFGILVRGCEERAINRIMAESRSCRLHPDRMVLVGFSCPRELAEECRCHKPWPDVLTAGEMTPGLSMDEINEMAEDPFEALEAWFEHSDRCLKCFGCRNSCPVCDCGECSMEIEAMVPQRELPASKSFLMTRAVHMVDRCVYCGMCEAACPADIPLKSLYRLVARTMGRTLPGAVVSGSSAPYDLFGMAGRK